MEMHGTWQLWLIAVYDLPSCSHDASCVGGAQTANTNGCLLGLLRCLAWRAAVRMVLALLPSSALQRVARQQRGTLIAVM